MIEFKGARQMPLSKKLILVIDDDIDIARFIAAALHKHGANVIAASSVSEASKQLGYFTFDVIVTDINMGDGTGYDVRNLVEHNSLPAPLIAISGALDAYMAKMDGFAYCLSKPFTFQELLDAVLHVTTVPVAN